MAQQKEEILEIDELLPKNEGLISSSLNDSKIRVVEKSRQNRLNLYHYITHSIAILIILPYIILLTLGNDMPASYTTIVSMVIGFYFGRALLFE